MVNDKILANRTIKILAITTFFFFVSRYVLKNITHRGFTHRMLIDAIPTWK